MGNSSIQRRTFWKLDSTTIIWLLTRKGRVVPSSSFLISLKNSSNVRLILTRGVFLDQLIGSRSNIFWTMLLKTQGFTKLLLKILCFFFAFSCTFNKLDTVHGIASVNIDVKIWRQYHGYVAINLFNKHKVVLPEWAFSNMGTNKTKPDTSKARVFASIFELIHSVVAFNDSLIAQNHILVSSTTFSAEGHDTSAAHARFCVSSGFLIAELYLLTSEI